jgi:hypothetical protein
MKTASRLWQKIAPASLQLYIRFLLEPKMLKERRKAVLKHYISLEISTSVPEIKEGLKYLRHNKFSAYPYYWTLKYDKWMPDVLWDESNHCFYIFYDGKKMFFPKRYSQKEVVWIVRSIYKEQDEKSPHLYLTPGFKIDEDSVVIDAGVAEGNFALSVVEKAKKLYLVECDPDWVEALRLTFAPWKEKVIIVQKLMSHSEGENTVSIDSLIGPIENANYFIKIDIEGYEQSALAGMKSLVASGKQIKMDICTYHKVNDINDFQLILKEYGFKLEVSDSYILFGWPGDVPEFRKVLIRATKM